MMQFIYGTKSSQTHGPQHLEACKQLESGREWVGVCLATLFPVGMSLYLGKPQVYAASIPRH